MIINFVFWLKCWFDSKVLTSGIKAFHDNWCTVYLFWIKYSLLKNFPGKKVTSLPCYFTTEFFFFILFYLGFTSCNNVALTDFGSWSEQQRDAISAIDAKQEFIPEPTTFTRNQHILRNKVFVCLCWGFTAQSTAMVMSSRSFTH